jgi:hypothetical protein
VPRPLSLYDAGVVQGRSWSPLSLRPDVWYDASDVSTVTGNPVSEIRDLSGKGNHATQATSSLRPSRFVHPTGRNCLYFDLSGEMRLEMSTVLSYTGEVSFFVATRAVEFSPRMMAFGGNDSSFWGSGAFECLFRNSGDSGVTLSRIDYDWHVVSGVRRGTGAGQTDLWQNGFWTSNGTLGGTINAANIAARLYAGSSWQTSHGWWCEAFIVPRAVTVAERMAAEGYLAQKWLHKIEGDHPLLARPAWIGD